MADMCLPGLAWPVAVVAAISLVFGGGYLIHRAALNDSGAYLWGGMGLGCAGVVMVLTCATASLLDAVGAQAP